MRDTNNVFHLAIPCANLEEIARFYQDGLGCRVARCYRDHLTLDFFGDQVVFHLSPDKIDSDPEMYPRHFGITFRKEEDFEAILGRSRDAELQFFREPFVRFSGLREEHRTFLLRDPSNNLVEFKYYLDVEMMY